MNHVLWVAVGLSLVFGGAAASAQRGDAWTLGGRLESGDLQSVLAAAGSAPTGWTAYLAGRAALGVSQPKLAAEHFARARGLVGLTADIARREGDAWLAAGDTSLARAAYGRALRSLGEGQPAEAKAMLVGLVRAMARGARDVQQCVAAERAMRDAALRSELGAPTAALVSLARCHERTGDLVEAARRYDRLVAFRVKSPLAAQARAALDLLAARKVTPPPMPLVDGLRAARVQRWAKRLDAAKMRLSALRPEGDVQTRLARFEGAELLHAEGDHKGAATAFRLLFDERPREPGAEGFLRMAARCLRESSQGKVAAETLLLAFKVARGPNRNGRDLWRAAELLVQEGEGVRAAKLWLSLALREKGHRDAPRAFVRALEAFIEAGAPALARKSAAKMSPAWARRRIAWRVRFLAAWAAYRMGADGDARRRFAHIEASARAPKLDRMRARYWRTRLLEKGDPRAARAAFAALLSDDPASFYADLATSRLRALGVTKLPALPLVPPSSVEPPRPRAEPAYLRPAQLSPAFVARVGALARRYARALPQLSLAMGLARAGLAREASDALLAAQADLDAARRRPSRRPAFGAAKPKAEMTARQRRRRALLRRIDRADFALALVPLYTRLGDRARAQMFRARFGRTREGRAARKQQRTYPTPFRDLVAAAAKAHHLPEPLLYAIMRQESAFRPDALSVVGARGLMQIMPKTGRLISERLGEKLARGALDEPALSVRYGAWYFWQLLVKYKGQVPLAIAAYNGGPRAVSRWLDRHKGGARDATLAADEFLEEIPFTETRRYVRKVLRSMRTYATLLGGGPGAYVPTTVDASYGDNINF